MRRRGVRTAIIVILVLVIMALAAEVILRTTHLFGARTAWVRADPVLGWRFDPGSEYYFTRETDEPITGTINSYGWRDREWTVEKPPGTYRIAVLGDSYVAVLHVDAESTFLALTERDLEQQGLRVELMNFGRPDFGQTEELITLNDEVIGFSPDLVIVVFTTGNIKFNRKETAQSRYRPFYTLAEDGRLILDTSFADTWNYKATQLSTWLRRHSALASMLIARLKQRGGPRPEEEVEDEEELPAGGQADARRKAKGGGLTGGLSLCTANATVPYLKSYAFSKVLIRAMVDICREHEVRFLLVKVDNRAYRPDAEARCRAIDPTFDPYWIDNDLRTFADSLGTDYLGLQQVFREAFEAHGKSLHRGHWNHLGHKVVAAALTAKLESIIRSVAPLRATSPDSTK